MISRRFRSAQSSPPPTPGPRQTHSNISPPTLISSTSPLAHSSSSNALIGVIHKDCRTKKVVRFGSRDFIKSIGQGLPGISSRSDKVPVVSNTRRSLFSRIFTRNQSPPLLPVSAQVPAPTSTSQASQMRRQSVTRFSLPRMSISSASSPAPYATLSPVKVHRSMSPEPPVTPGLGIVPFRMSFDTTAAMVGATVEEEVEKQRKMRQESRQFIFSSPLLIDDQEAQTQVLQSDWSQEAPQTSSSPNAHIVSPWTSTMHQRASSADISDIILSQPSDEEDIYAGSGKQAANSVTNRPLSIIVEEEGGGKFSPDRSSRSSEDTVLNFIDCYPDSSPDTETSSMYLEEEEVLATPMRAAFKIPATPPLTPPKNPARQLKSLSLPVPQATRGDIASSPLSNFVFPSSILDPLSANSSISLISLPMTSKRAAQSMLSTPTDIDQDHLSIRSNISGFSFVSNSSHSSSKLELDALELKIMGQELIQESNIRLAENGHDSNSIDSKSDLNSSELTELASSLDVRRTQRLQQALLIDRLKSGEEWSNEGLLVQ